MVHHIGLSTRQERSFDLGIGQISNLSADIV